MDYLAEIPKGYVKSYIKFARGQQLNNKAI